MASNLEGKFGVGPSAAAQPFRSFALLESLEGRRLMSGTPASAVSLADGHLVLRGEQYRPNTLSVEVNRTGGSIRGVVNGHAGAWMDVRHIDTIVIDGGERNDAIVVDGKIAVPVRVDAKGGDDSIRTAKGNDTIYGGEGNDTVFSNAGDDRIEVGAGKDRVDAGEGDDYIVGGDGNDVLYGVGGNDYVRGDGGRDRIDGGSGDDTLIGDRNDTIIGSGGADLYRFNASRLLAADGTGAGTTVNRVTGFTLIDADKNQPVPGYLDLADGETLDLSKLPAHLSIRANAPAGFKGSIEMKVGGKAVRTENFAPYALYGDDGGNFHAGAIPTGSLRLEGIAYAQTNKGGGAGGGRAVTLNVVGKPAAAVKTPAVQVSATKAPTAVAKPAAVPAAVATPTPTPTPAVSTNTPTITPTATGSAPVARIQTLIDNAPLGTAIHVDGLVSTLNAGDAEDGKFEWDFGDAGSRFNAMVGFNAAHLYAKPGTYTVRLTVTNAAGKMDSATARVTVKAAARKVLYVSNAGKDSNDGRTADHPLKTFKKAAALAGDNTEILFARGETFNLDDAMRIYGTNVVVGAYGIGERPTLNWVGGLGLSDMIYTGPGAKNVTVRDLTFTSKYGGTESPGMPFGLRIGGENITVVGNQFLNVGYAINSNGKPTGALVQDNTAPSPTGVRAYFLWGSGRNFVIQGNYVANSTREHVLRMSGISHVTVAHNDFTNLDRRAEGDRYDGIKGAIVAQVGEYAYIADNIVNGPLAIGPLGEQDGLHAKDNRFTHVVATRNDITGSMLEVKHGAEHVTLHDNVMHLDGGTSIEVEGFNAEYGRGVVDLVIDHNTAINASDMGRFLQVQGKVDGIVLTNNLYLAKQLRPGAYGASAIYVAQSDLSSFIELDHNVWPSGSNGTTYANGGVAWVGTGSAGPGYLTPAQWEDRARVTNSTFRDVQFDPHSYHATLNGYLTGARLAA